MIYSGVARPPKKPSNKNLKRMIITVIILQSISLQ